MRFVCAHLFAFPFLVRRPIVAPSYRTGLLRLHRTCSLTHAALAKPHARVFDLTGRPMKAWVLVKAKGWLEDAQLEKWVDRAATVVA